MIFQAPGYVAILNEMVHNARIIPILFEYACHEGNYGLHGILAGARRMERLGRELRP